MPDVFTSAERAAVLQELEKCDPYVRLNTVMKSTGETLGAVCVRLLYEHYVGCVQSRTRKKQ